MTSDLDVSMSGQTYRQAFQVRMAKEGRGRGCFAVRDVAPGEVILISYTRIHWPQPGPNDRRRDRFARLIDIYNTSHESVQLDWLAMSPLPDPKIQKSYLLSLLSVGRDGTFFEHDIQKRHHYLRLMLNADHNSIRLRDGETGVWPKAAIFNHSCDPNVHYWVNPRSYRWVGVATRAIKKGEEMCIAYIPTHNLRFQRQAQLEERWGFRCACSKCKEGEDEYTQSLIDARNAGIPYESKRSEPAAYFEDNFDQFRDTIERRIALLREICESVKDGKEGESRRMELTFALIDGYTFHRDHWHILVQDAKDAAKDAPEDQADRIRQDLDHALIHVKQDRAYTYEALTWARRAWDPKDQMIYNLTEELKKIEATLVDMTRSGEAEAGSTPSPRHANEGAAPLFSSDPLFDSSPGDRIE
ncbi:hypothetical protein F5Y08DRAFT_352248 [Xylaria arbuscula]|nr:hypothetical protein F5Y08DRAFT_352248 [Xylaria arbuscula]